MSHWMDPLTRGVYTHPSAIPPRPRSRAANDHGERLARVEEHLSFAANNLYRVEMESHRRGADIKETVQDHEKRLQNLERHKEKDQNTKTLLLSLVGTVRGSVGVLVQFVVAVLATTMLLTGHANVAKIKELLSIWGVGSPGG